MTHYTANLRDLEFNLFEFLDTKDKFGTGPFEQMDAETARALMTPGEVMQLPPADELVLVAGHPPVSSATGRLRLGGSRTRLGSSRMHSASSRTSWSAGKTCSDGRPTRSCAHFSRTRSVAA